MYKITGLTLLLFINVFNSSAQPEVRIKNSYGYEIEQIDQVRANYYLACELIAEANNYLQSKYDLNSEASIEKWNSDSTLITWLGKADSKNHIRKATRRLQKMTRQTEKRVHLSFDNERRRGLCRGSRHAWTVPKGKLLIHLCPQFMYKSNQLQTKIFVHEIGHESGILFHKKVYWRSAALRTARLEPQLALKNPENFAFFIMSFSTSNMD